MKVEANPHRKIQRSGGGEHQGMVGTRRLMGDRGER